MDSLPLSDQKPQAFEALHSHLLLGFPALVRLLGGNAEFLLSAVGLHADPDGSVLAGVSYPQHARLLELAALELGCADFGLRLARVQIGRERFGPLSEVMRSVQTFGEALGYVSNHSYAHSLAARVWMRPSEDGTRTVVGHDILVGGIPNKSQAMEQLLLLGHLGALEYTGGAARARGVRFRHQPVSPLATYRRCFGCEVQFGQREDAIEFLASDLASKIVAPDATTFTHLANFIESNFIRRTPPLHAQTRGVIMHLLGASSCSNDEVARELRLHPRTLHRQLAREGTSFQKVKDEVRRDLMLYYLQHTELEIMVIAEKLGFAEQAVMTRKCRQWWSATPTELRRRKTDLR